MVHFVRPPAVAGLFYPDSPQELAQWVNALTPEVESEPALGLIVPHAGLRYSGGVAGATLARAKLPSTTLILCPKHTRLGASTAIMSRGSWQMPGGEVFLAEELAQHLLKRIPTLTEDSAAHEKEHAIEVILPFLQKHQPKGRIVPIAMDYRSVSSCREFGLALGQAVRDWNEPVMLLSSTDMNHFEDQETTLRKDQLALDEILALNPEGLHRVCREQQISMCGVVPTVVMLFALQSMRLSKATLVEHTTSAAVSGDTQRVVGYAGLLLQ